jgi:hypothetical protein
MANPSFLVSHPKDDFAAPPTILIPDRGSA